MNKDIEESTKQEKKRRGFVFWLGRFFLVLLAIFFSVLVLIEIPFIQKWGAGKISDTIANTLNTKASIGGFSLNPISDLTLDDVFIGSPDRPQDTLIRVVHLHVDFQNIWDLFYNAFTINQVRLDDGFLNIEKKAGDTLTNLDIAMLRLRPEKRDTTRAPFVLDLERISATQLRVKIDDNTQGSLIDMVFKRADVELDTMDMTGQYMRIGEMDFDEPLIHVTNKSRKDVIPSSVKKSDKFWSFDVNSLNWTDGKIYIDNQNKPEDTSQVYGIDYAHMILADVDIAADSLRIRGFEFNGKNINIHILHQNGFEIKELSSSDASLTSNGINIKDLVLKTPESEIHNSIELQYSGFDDFKSFADSVNLLIPSADIHLHIIDLLAVAPALGKVSFFSDNKDKVFTLTGNVNGRINRLKVLQMNADIGGIILAGDFRSHDLAVPGNQLINMNLDRARFSATSLKDIFPKMKIPAMMNRFGQISFTGKFDGYPDDFVAFGTFNTALGAVTLDMKLNTIRGFEQGKYSGEISLANFDLGTFLNQPDIGRVSMTGRVIEGEGLNAQTLSADLSAVMSSFTYKNYTYQNARLDGQVSNKLFSGTIDIHDPNVDMMFEGTVDFRGEMPILDFITRIDDIRFLELGFGKIPIAVSGIFDVDLTAGKIDQFQGSLVGENVMVKIRDDIYSLDSLYVDALIDSVSNDRYYNIKSNVVSGVFSGVFDPLTLANQLQQYLNEHYPSLIDPPKKIMAVKSNQRLSWDLHIHDSGVWFELAGIKDLVIKNAYTQGTLNLQDQQTTGFLELPELHYAGVNVYGSTLNFKEQKGKTEIDLEVIAADLKENLFFEDVLISGSVTDDSMRVRVKTDDIAEIIQQLDMEITADPDEGAWAFSFNPIKLEMLDGSWSMPSGNLVQIKKDEFNLENFELTSGDRKITIDDINNKGIDAFITGFDVSYLNSLWINDKFQFSGIYTLKLEVDNVYNIRQLSTVLNVPALKVNNVPYGEWTFNAAMSDPKDSVKIDLVMNNNETHMTGKGAYLPPINTIPKEKQNYLRLAIEGTEFPLDFLEFLLGGNIRDTEGSVDFTLNLEGKTNKLNPRGKGRVYNGSTTINYLGTAYAFHDQPFEITETRIDLTGAKLYDVQGNSATIRGGLTHRYLKNLGLDASIHADKIIALDVTSEENTNFYGMGIGKVDAIFSGTIANPNMEINMTSAKGTHIFIPLSAAAVGTGKDFVIFLENGVLPASTTNLNKLSGINLTMNMTVTEDAEVEIIFDPNTGEVLRAVGRGDIKLAMTRTGNFTMYGDYRISRGDYLFTNLKIVRKQFELLPGGQISWEGDPYDATIDIRAKYKGLTAPIYTLIQEYTVNNPQIADEARERTEVDLTMILTGSLLHPNIAFDIEFPSLTGEIKGYADAKISALKANEVAMNEQVVGLLFTGSFLPSSGVSSLSITKGIDNTLTDFISSTLSSMLGGLLANLAPEAGFFTGIDLQVGIDVPITSSGTINSEGEIVDPARQEYYANLPLEFFNDRLSVNLGGNYVTGSTLTTTSEYLAGDVRVEYWITPDRRLKILAYNRNNMTIEGRKNKFGVGLAYRREYNSVKEIFSRKSKKPKEKDIETSGG